MMPIRISKDGRQTSLRLCQTLTLAERRARCYMVPACTQVAEISAKLAPFELLVEPTMGGEDFSFIAEKARCHAGSRPQITSVCASTLGLKPAPPGRRA